MLIYTQRNCGDLNVALVSYEKLLMERALLQRVIPELFKVALSHSLLLTMRLL